MGDIAEMMLEGILDEQTGEYIGDGCGYPRTRYFKRRKERTPEEEFIIKNYLTQIGMTHPLDQTRIIQKFCKEQKLSTSDITIQYKRIRVSAESWKAFKEFVKLFNQ